MKDIEETVVGKVREILGEKKLYVVKHNYKPGTFMVMGEDKEWHAINLIDDVDNKFINNVDTDGDMCSIILDEKDDKAMLVRQPMLSVNSTCLFEIDETGV